MKKIKRNVRNFYSDLSKNDDNTNNNVYKYLIELKEVISQNYEKSINFIDLFNYSKKFPFKYLMIQSENKSDYIYFDEVLVEQNFKLFYSFPLIEHVINNMIEDYDTNEKINIKNLSGSAFGNALEIKIRDYISKNQKIDIRKV